MRKSKLYKITWRDHYSTQGWHDPLSTDLPEVILESVGFYIYSDKNYHHIAQTFGDEVCAEMMSIMKTQVIEIKELI